MHGDMDKLVTEFTSFVRDSKCDLKSPTVLTLIANLALARIWGKSYLGLLRAWESDESKYEHMLSAVHLAREHEKLSAEKKGDEDSKDSKAKKRGAALRSVKNLFPHLAKSQARLVRQEMAYLMACLSKEAADLFADSQQQSVGVFQAKDILDYSLVNIASLTGAKKEVAAITVDFRYPEARLPEARVRTYVHRPSTFPLSLTPFLSVSFIVDRPFCPEPMR